MLQADVSDHQRFRAALINLAEFSIAYNARMILKSSRLFKRSLYVALAGILLWKRVYHFLVGGKSPFLIQSGGIAGMRRGSAGGGEAGCEVGVFGGFGIWLMRSVQVLPHHG